LTGGSRERETVAQEAGGLPLDLRTASRSAAPVPSVFLSDRTRRRLDTFCHFSRYSSSGRAVR
jgi:hypothetical protein